MTPEKIQPLYSAFEDDLELEEELSGFVVSLAEDVDLIQDAETAGSLPDVGSRARLLAQRAERFGYRLLTEIASEVVQASDQDKPEVVQTHLRALTHVACRIRRGHRGAA